MRNISDTDNNAGGDHDDDDDNYDGDSDDDDDYNDDDMKIHELTFEQGYEIKQQHVNWQAIKSAWQTIVEGHGIWDVFDI